VIPNPCWVSYAPQARIVGSSICPLPTRFEDRWLPTPGSFERLCEKDERKPRLLILNYPANPAGTTLSEPELGEIARIAECHRMVVLSDEIYGKLHHDGEHRSIVPLLPERTIFSGGLSKWCGAGGWRLGLFVFPRELAWLRGAMSAVATETFTSTCAPVQHAAVRAFRPDARIDRYLDHSRRILRALGRELHRILEVAGARVAAPQGGFYLFPDFSPLRDALAARGVATSRELCERLLEETGVATLPGSDFGRPDEELTARIAYVDFDGAAALDAAGETDPFEPDSAFLERHCGDVLEAVRRIAGWAGETA